MTKERKFIVGSIALLLLLLLAGFSEHKYLTQTTNENVYTEQPTICTTDAKICPDGSSVGRTGPSCTFSECPIPKPQPIIEATTTPPTPPSQSSTSGACMKDSDCATGYSCIDPSPVVREGSSNL